VPWPTPSRRQQNPDSGALHRGFVQRGFYDVLSLRRSLPPSPSPDIIEPSTLLHDLAPSVSIRQSRREHQIGGCVEVAQKKQKLLTAIKAANPPHQ
jgi:hypothetical protein